MFLHLRHNMAVQLQYLGWGFGTLPSTRPPLHQGIPSWSGARPGPITAELRVEHAAMMCLWPGCLLFTRLTPWLKVFIFVVCVVVNAVVAVWQGYYYG